MMVLVLINGQRPRCGCQLGRLKILYVKYMSCYWGNKK
jgi:hypothetical protein